RFYVSGVTCCPSRTGFMTGVHTARYQKYPSGHGFGDQLTVTELLKKRGYHIGHYGKWHIGPEKGTVYGIDEYGPEAKHKGDPRGRDAVEYDEAIEFIERNADKPFYLNIWGHITHYAVNAPDDQVAALSDLTVDRSDFSETMQHKFEECDKINRSVDEGMREYVAELQALDSHVQRVLDTLEKLNLTENTIVAFSSDHGPAPVILASDKKGEKPFAGNMLGYAGELRGGKHSQYEGGVRSPFIVRWPKKIPAGRVDTQNITSGLDWLPTLCSIAGVEKIPDNVDGEDVSSVWFGENRDREKPLFWKTSSTGAAPSMLDGNWKLHLNRKNKGGPELYDLTADPSESNNIIEDHPEIAKKMIKKTRDWVSTLPTEYIKTGKDRED
ncbi:MAG: sulfatase-like hydrolase/transferase, partial [Verrucomicrobiota bacterium]